MSINFIDLILSDFWWVIFVPYFTIVNFVQRTLCATAYTLFDSFLVMYILIDNLKNSWMTVCLLQPIVVILRYNQSRMSLHLELALLIQSPSLTCVVLISSMAQEISILSCWEFFFLSDDEIVLSKNGGSGMKFLTLKNVLILFFWFNIFISIGFIL